MSGNNRLRHGTSRVDARILLRLLKYISDHGGVAAPELVEHTGLSRATIIRMMGNARAQYGVVITWRRDNTMPSNGEYSVDDFGVFDPVKINQFLSASDSK